uniref:Odorant-binding protein 37 n=1 Tax=Encarsia formosa TaxID=32400 RepID=A0A514TTZ3_ENCFO|nr:odorant-binding protein 37 [Encarsia formosa]
MKMYIFLTSFLVTVLAIPEGFKFRSSSPGYFRQCLIKYKINPLVIAFYEEKGNGNQDEINKLSPLQKACIDVCHFKEAGAVKPDDSLDIESFYIDFLNDGFSEVEKSEFTRNLNRCRAEAGKDDCKLLLCLELFEDA